MRVKFICFFFILDCFAPFVVRSETLSRLHVYNSAFDTFYTKAKETVAFSDLKELFRKYPGDFKLIGVGLGSKPARLGNYFISGTTRNPITYWADPRPPYPMSKSSDVNSSFLALAVANPTAVFKRVIENAPNFLVLLANQLEKFKYIKLAAIRIVGRFKAVRFAVTESILKSGENGPVRKEISFTQNSPQHWEMVGMYAHDQSLQLQISSPGYPVHLHGLQKGARNGGHIISASVDKADVYIYPIREFDLFQNDLIIDGDRSAGKIKVSVTNVGLMEADQVEIQVKVLNTSTILRKIVSSLQPGQKAEVSFEDTVKTRNNTVHIQVDPNNFISELREDNNIKILPPGYAGTFNPNRSRNNRAD